MNENEEPLYEQGSRAAWAAMLRQCVRHLGYDSEETTQAGWIAEREASIAKLRQVCVELGDNDWPDNAHLADVIEKHLRWDQYYSQVYADQMRDALLRIQSIALEPKQTGNREVQMQNIAVLAIDALVGIKGIAKGMMPRPEA